MGGSASEEFLFPCDIGEDTFVQCASCRYSANTEAVRVGAAAPVDHSSTPGKRVVDTPNTPTIQTLVDLFNARDDLRRTNGEWQASDTLKNVVVMLRHPDGRNEPLAVGVPGDREVDMKRLEAQVAPAEVQPFEEADFAKHPALVKGYIGPGALGTKNASGIRYLLDPRIAVGSEWITGADQPGKHVMHLVNGRDFVADGVIDVAEVRDDDTCPKCGSSLEIRRGIEIGHVFQLGRKYAETLDLQVLDQNGKQRVVTMGSYGIGVSRAVAAIAEASHDELGLRWPREIAPFDAHVVIAGKDDGSITQTANQIAEGLQSSGMRVVLDDRTSVSPGVKFKDAELLGVPTIVVVGKGLADGVIEVRDRRSGDKRDVPVADVVDVLVETCR